MEIQLHINSFSVESLQIGRFVKYVSELNKLFGSEGIHFLEVREGSASPTLKIDQNNEIRVLKIIESANSVTPDPKIKKTCRNINDLLREDNTDGFLSIGKENNVLSFPGINQPAEEESIFPKEQITLHGMLLSIGGKDSTVPFLVYDKISGHHQRGNCSRELARKLGGNLFSPLHIYGAGQWSIIDGKRKLINFHADGFETLSNDSIREVFRKLKNSPDNAWGKLDNPMEHLETLRHGKENSS